MLESISRGVRLLLATHFCTPGVCVRPALSTQPPTTLLCRTVVCFVLWSHPVFVPGPAGGLSTVLPPSWLRLFSPSELNQLISGGLDTGVDVEDMTRWGTKVDCCTLIASSASMSIHVVACLVAFALH